VRSIVAVRQRGGVALPNGDHVMPDTILMGSNADKVQPLRANMASSDQPLISLRR